MSLRRALIPLLLAALIALVLPPPAHASPGSGFKRVVFYYGWLDTSNLLDFDFDILVFAGTTIEANHWAEVVARLHKRGVETFAYLHDGEEPVELASSFKKMVVDKKEGSLEERVKAWKEYIKGLIDWYAEYNNEHGKVIDGVFFDECDPEYFGVVDPEDELLKAFSEALKALVDYAHSRGLKVFISGVRAYAGYGDYYLWTDFVTTYEGGDYIIDPYFFNPSGGDNPYAWTSGIAKYEYLKEHGLLSKTIALSYVPRDDVSMAAYGYVAARILGLGGWAFADADVFASGGAIQMPVLPELGDPVAPPEISPEDKTLRRAFTMGDAVVVLDPGSPEVHYPLEEYSRSIIIDGRKDANYTAVSAEAGEHSWFNDAAYAVGPMYVYFYADMEWEGEQWVGDCLLHIYIDSDGSAETGFKVGDLGADYLVEVYHDSAPVYRYVGPDWNWERIGEALVCIRRLSEAHYVVELAVSRRLVNVSLDRSAILLATVLKNWNDDSGAQADVESSAVVSRTASIYDPPESHKSTAEHAPVILGYKLEANRLIVTIDAPSGYWLYHFDVPFSVQHVIKEVNGTQLELRRRSDLSGDVEGWRIVKSDGYTEVEIKVRHASPVTLIIIGATSGGATAASTGLGGVAEQIGLTSLMMIIVAVCAALEAASILAKRFRSPLRPRSRG